MPAKILAPLRLLVREAGDSRMEARPGLYVRVLFSNPRLAVDVEGDLASSSVDTETSEGKDCRVLRRVGAGLDASLLICRLALATAGELTSRELEGGVWRGDSSVSGVVSLESAGVVVNLLKGDVDKVVAGALGRVWPPRVRALVLKAGAGGEDLATMLEPFFSPAIPGSTPVAASVSLGCVMSSCRGRDVGAGRGLVDITASGA